MSSGAPAATAASRTMRAASQVHFFALGCGLKMIAFLVLSAISDLKIAVLVGFVVGMIPQMTPFGSAIFSMPKPVSSSMIPQVLSSLYLWKMYSAAKWFLITLSSTIPIPVSCTASCAREIRALLAAMAAARKILSTCSCV